MKKISILKCLELLGISCLTFFLLTGFLTAILEHGLHSDETAAWLQALASIATIVTALYIWTGDRKERRQDRMAIALVASVGMSHRATIYRDELEYCARILPQLESFNYQRDNLENIFDRLSELPEWTVDEIHRLSALGDCAIDLARAQYSTQAAIRIFKEVLTSSKAASLEFLYPKMHDAANLLHTAEWNIDEALRKMVSVGKPDALGGTDKRFVDGSN